MIYLLCFILFSIGLYCILMKKDMVKIIIGVSIMDCGVYLLLILIGYRIDGRSPIKAPFQDVQNMVDPLPQVLVLTAIVIGVAVLGLLIAVALRLYEKYGTFDITEIRKLKG